MAGQGRIYQWLSEAAKRGGGQRALYTSETTLSRRGLLTRTDRRARELAQLGIGRGQVVAIALGNVADYFVALMAVSKLGALAMPVDPANGDGRLLAAMRRLPVRAVLRRQRGQESEPLHYPSPYALRSRRQLPNAMVALDLLDPPRGMSTAPESAELAFEAIGGDDVYRDVLRDGDALEAIGRAAAELLSLEAGTRLLCVQPLTEPSFFDPAVLGWLASDAQLVVTGGPGLDSALALALGAQRTVAIGTIENFLGLARALNVADRTAELVPVLPGPSTSPLPERVFERRFGHRPLELLQLEEVGIVGARAGTRAKSFVLAPGVSVEADPIADADGGRGSRVMVHTPQAGALLPPAPEATTGWRAASGAVASGYLGDIGRGGDLRDIFGLADGLLHIEGRRACALHITRAMCRHRRIIWAEPYLEVDADGEPILKVRYAATGETELEDLEEHAVRELDPFMVPRSFERVPERR